MKRRLSAPKPILPAARPHRGKYQTRHGIGPGKIAQYFARTWMNIAPATNGTWQAEIVLVAQSRRSIACAQNNHCPRVSGPNAFVLWIPHSPPPDTGTILNSIMAFQCTRDGLYAMAHECRRLLHGAHSVEVGRVTRMGCSDRGKSKVRVTTCFLACEFRAQ